MGSGLAVNGLGTASTNTVCSACDAASRYYSDVNDYSTCKVKKFCIRGEGVKDIGNSNVNTVCEACDASTKKYSDADDYGTCKTHTPCAAGAGVSVAGTATSDTQCENCVAAADDTDRIGSFSTGIGYVEAILV